MKFQIVLSFILGAALATSSNDNVGLLMQKVSVHDFTEEGTGSANRLQRAPEWFPETDECFTEYCQSWKDLREYYCCGNLVKDDDHYCIEDPDKPNICNQNDLYSEGDAAPDPVSTACHKHLLQYGLRERRLAPHRRNLYSPQCGGYKVKMSSTCSSCGGFTKLTMEEGIKAWNDRNSYFYHSIPSMLIGSEMFRGCHKCYPIGTVFTLEGVPPERKVCAWGERGHLYRHGKFPKILLDHGWTQVENESMVWEVSPTWSIPIDIFCKSSSAGGTITLPPTEGSVFVGGFAVEAECDWGCYMDRYPDITAWSTLYRDGSGKAKEHWQEKGKAEGRICTCPPADCNWFCYLERYPDVAAHFGSDMDADTAGAQRHYENHGAAEGRDCSCTGSLYKKKVPKLVDLGGSGCKASNKCTVCQGDCDSDADCASGLRCFQRSTSGHLVPGCDAGGSGDKGTHDYCYEPGSYPPGTLVDLGDSGCKASKKCAACQGDCDSDADCASGLKCFQRDTSAKLVPGCVAGGSGDRGTHDYCYDPGQAPYRCPHGYDCDLECAARFSSFDGSTCANAGVGYCCKANGCSDTDNGATDSVGDSCAYYIAPYCGLTDTSEFLSNTMCCICGGGSSSEVNSQQKAGA